ncbi:isoprenylcysteine carboxylmethyltransferase family protein [bacterium M00.F.Ca.ET.228.01.1.1]|uniref:methyltransferase family protein n=1 Tax=Paraburkholderia phenoliruptrix TaxID=252970 RepID=UPI0010929BF1|nr:isoprenylcysteine carboxylmethyltransferase family protein [Paraburkholderia phenoliruptrix]TGP42679.1 isoprenylcysteine carboxylmethyltransferase family protein [bacterium M00.F.Ca.ET.228.01.1.1]TGR95404.1 isoprenylcysteine carboxylmethyltransferase family protein [bacterium M00.F.Ca.ET.191.01.1.1]TGT96293.1 isoprenylcysteine carboxylmethyltransferase family protein [bacterium M00.F.Ca.ET.155.01.1.1]MBW0447411.1 isoprenylcysteine carboxylmethyltransferase family protein [Paraburkholderia ph
MNGTASGYGLWGLVIVNSLVFIIFAFSFFKPATKRDWRTFGGFSAFVVALFAEMYGFPLTIFLLSGWLQTRFPQADLLAHDSGHLWWMMTGQRGNPHFGLPHLLSLALLFGGFALLSSAWHVLYDAQRKNRLATTGPYAKIRHPQYVAFVVIMFGFLLQWPTLITLVMFPILVFMYVRLAKHEERESEQRFGQAWLDYAAHTPRFIPKLPGNHRLRAH